MDPRRPVIVALSLVLLAAPAVAEDLRVEEHLVGGKPVVVVRPAEGGPWPVVYALAGLGEMVRGPRASAHGWVEKYGLLEAYRAVRSGRLRAGHFGDLVTGDLLQEYQRRAQDFRGLVIVSPAAPRSLDRAFERHLMDEVIPWAEASLPIKKGARHRGIDGISLGGRHALRLGLKHPAAFRALGTEQASVKGLWPEIKRLVARAEGAAKRLRINLLTSERDGFRPAITRFSQQLKALGLTVRYHVTPGRHDKRFARGPGAIDMLLFHDEALR